MEEKLQNSNKIVLEIRLGIAEIHILHQYIIYQLSLTFRQNKFNDKNRSPSLIQCNSISAEMVG